MGIYQSLYDLINTYIFGGEAIAGSIQDLAITLISLSGCIFLISLPFLIVWRIIRIL